jgi:peptide/nickel transport system substrate-binding protein
VENVSRRLDRRTFLGSALAGGAIIAANGLLDAASASGAIAKRPSSVAGRRPAVRRGGNLTVGLTGGGSTDTLNPWQAGITEIGEARCQNLYQPLITLNNDAQLQYVLADEITPKGSTSNWTIRLKEGVLFHNGKPFGADDVIYNFRTVLNPKAPQPGGAILTPIDVNGIKKIDNLTVEVPMKVPFGGFPELLAAFYWFMYMTSDGWKPGDKPNGTGPFEYKSFTPGEQSVFVRNKNYWKHGLPYLDSVTILDFSDPTAVVNALISGAIDGTCQLTGTQRRVLEQSTNIKTVVSHTGEIQPFTMRVDKPPFNDVNVRQAFRYLINRPEFVSTTLDSYGVVASDVFSPYDPYFDHSLRREQDLDLAKHLLKKAGYDNDLTVTLYTSLAITSSAVPMATLFKEQASAAGVTVNIDQVAASDFFGPDFYTKVPFAMIEYPYSPYLAQVAQVFLPTSPFLETHFNDPHYTKLYNEANSTLNTSRLHEIEYEMQQIDFTQGGYIIPCFIDAIDAYNVNVSGYEKSEIGQGMGNFNFEVMTLS